MTLLNCKIYLSEFQCVLLKLFLIAQGERSSNKELSYPGCWRGQVIKQLCKIIVLNDKYKTK